MKNNYFSALLALIALGGLTSLSASENRLLTEVTNESDKPVELVLIPYTIDNNSGLLFKMTLESAIKGKRFYVPANESLTLTQSFLLAGSDNHIKLLVHVGERLFILPNDSFKDCSTNYVKALITQNNDLEWLEDQHPSIGQETGIPLASITEGSKINNVDKILTKVENTTARTICLLMISYLATEQAESDVIGKNLYLPPHETISFENPLALSSSSQQVTTLSASKRLKKIYKSDLFKTLPYSCFIEIGHNETLRWTENRSNIRTSPFEKSKNLNND